jgi:hypothetical protein
VSAEGPTGAHERDLNELIAELNTRLAEAREERDLAIAHDRQPYPTAWAYEQACKALEVQRARAEQAEATVERVRALHSPEEDPRRTRDCKGCRTVATYTPYEDCKTLAALDASGGES